MDLKLLDILICPNYGNRQSDTKQCGAKLSYRAQEQELICLACGESYQIRDGLPILLAEEHA